MKVTIKSIKTGEFIENNFAWIILIVLFTAFSIFSNYFLSLHNILNILMQNAYIIVAALGVTFLMLSGNMDLSVGYQMSLNGIIYMMIMTHFNIPVYIVIVIALVLGATMSLVNMILSIKLKLPLLLVTLATMTCYQGIAYEISQSKVISDFPESFTFIGQGYIGSLPFPLLLTFILILITAFMLGRTYFGRYVYALGGNIEAARLSGINVNEMKIIISVICGMFIALSSIMLYSRLGSVHAGTGPGTEFTAITGICLGGVSIWGGKGKVSGVLAGVLILALISNGMQLVGLGTFLQYFVKGIILLLAFGFDIFQKNRRLAVKKTQIDSEVIRTISK